jgi:DNA-binding MarR family transcriptional regulator
MASEITESEKKLWRSFTLMRRQLDLTLERRLQADAGISTADYEILQSLSENAAKRLRAGQIADIIGWEKSRVSHQISRMEARSLVKREECGDDARGVWVVLTEDGDRAVQNALRDRRDAVRHYFFDALTDEQRANLLDISRSVLDTINPPICSEPQAASASELRAAIGTTATATSAG